jgi:hypothetical protein
MEQGGFGGQYETGMSSRGSCRTTGFRPAYVGSGSKGAVLTLYRRLPVYPNKQILLVSVGKSQTANAQSRCAPARCAGAGAERPEAS